MSEEQGYNVFDLLELIYELSWRIKEILPDHDSSPVTLLLGGDAAAVFNGVRSRSANGLCVFAASPPEISLIARVADSLEAGNDLRIQLTDRALQAELNAVPQIMRRLVTDAASVDPIYHDPYLKVIVPRWEIPYAITMHELAFDNHEDEDEDRTLQRVASFLVFYLLATTSGALHVYILESSVQAHVRALYPEEKRFVPRSTFDKVNRRCRERFNRESILFEG